MKLLLLLIAFIFNTNVAHAQSFTSADQNQDISGDWVFQKVVDYDEPNMKINVIQELKRLFATLPFAVEA